MDLRIGAVFGSSAIELNLDTFTCLCMFDCAARMNTFSGLASDPEPQAESRCDHHPFHARGWIMAGVAGGK
jgi:hypothetical protein